MDKLEHLELLQRDLNDLMESWVIDIEGLNGTAIAAILMSTAMRIYRSSMSDEDYNKVIDMISESRDKIKKYDIPIDKSKLN